LGLRLHRSTVVADDLNDITQALQESSERSRAIIVFGGLGPTSDDKTAECVAKILKCKIVEHIPSKEKLFSYLSKRGREVTSATLKQILYPEATQVIINPKGLAPGFFSKWAKPRHFFFLGFPWRWRLCF